MFQTRSTEIRQDPQIACRLIYCVRVFVCVCVCVCVGGCVCGFVCVCQLDALFDWSGSFWMVVKFFFAPFLGQMVVFSEPHREEQSCVRRSCLSDPTMRNRV